MSKRLFGLSISQETMQEIADRIIDAARHNEKMKVYAANAHYINLALTDSEYLNILHQGDIITADGAAIVWSCRARGISVPERSSTTDLVHPILKAAGKHGLRVFFLGGKPGTAERASQFFHNQYGVCIQTADGYFTDDRQMITKINKFQPHILFVGLGAPKQEKWVNNYHNSLESPAIVTCGGLFDYYAENVSRAPKFIQDAGLEWLYRLIQEPHRLWRRYLLGNPLFVYNLLKHGNLTLESRQVGRVPVLRD